MLAFPNCKINLGLHILRKRADGYHDIDTVFYPIPLKDVLEIIPATTTRMAITGTVIPGDNADNSCLKAYALLKKDFPSLPPVHIHLHKIIPTGAGLGGGSADAAFTLALLNKQFGLGLSAEQLLAYALQSGSDAPFFILNKPAQGLGRGEELKTLPLNLDGYKILVVNPGIHVNTAEAFAKITPAIPAKTIATIISQPIHTWKDELVNDFEATVFARYPELKNIKTALYDQGALYAAMSGSGSTIYGIFKNEQAASPSFPAHYFVKMV